MDIPAPMIYEQVGRLYIANLQLAAENQQLAAALAAKAEEAKEQDPPK